GVPRQQLEVEAAVGGEEPRDVAGLRSLLDFFGDGPQRLNVGVVRAVDQGDRAGDLQHAPHLADLVEVVIADGKHAEAAVAYRFDDALVHQGEHGFAHWAVGYAQADRKS